LETRKKILVAPLNWGLGHATRCIPIIEALENHGFEPIIASDGAALMLLKKEFPQHTALELPAYQLEYAKQGAFFNIRVLLQMGLMFNTIKKEQRIIKHLVTEHGISGIISDNRLGVYYKGIPSIFITHQVNMLSGTASGLASSLHRRFIKKYIECWIPDVKASPNLSGKLGHSEEDIPNLKYIGPISRLHKTSPVKHYDLAVLLSGAEPHRTTLENKLEEELKRFEGQVIMVRGVVEEHQVISQKGNITRYNFMSSDELEEVLNKSELILCRPSYSSIMDIAKLCKKAFFIPAPENEEQEYLAKKLKRAGLAPFASQNAFKIEDLEKAKMYKGLRDINGVAKWKDLFTLFEGK